MKATRNPQSRLGEAEILRELRDMALLEAKATVSVNARRVWRDVFNWAEAEAARRKLTIGTSPGATGPETANDRVPVAAGSTCEGERTRTGGSQAELQRLRHKLQAITRLAEQLTEIVELDGSETELRLAAE